MVKKKPQCLSVLIMGWEKGLPGAHENPDVWTAGQVLHVLRAADGRGEFQPCLREKARLLGTGLNGPSLQPLVP